MWGQIKITEKWCPLDTARLLLYQNCNIRVLYLYSWNCLFNSFHLILTLFFIFSAPYLKTMQPMSCPQLRQIQ